MKVTKKNGKVVLFDDEKVVRSILKANAEVPGEAMMRKTAQRYANEVFDRLHMPKPATLVSGAPSWIVATG